MSPVCFAAAYLVLDIRTTGMGLRNVALVIPLAFLTTLKITVQHNVKSECAWSKIRSFGSFMQWSDDCGLLIKIKRTEIKKRFAHGCVNTLMQDGQVSSH